MTVDLTTPDLVRHYRDLHVKGSHRRLTNSEFYELSRIVSELRHRGVLD